MATHRSAMLAPHATDGHDLHRAPVLLDGDDDGLLEGVTDTFRRHFIDLADGEMNNSAFIRIEGSDFLSEAAVARLFRQEFRHLLQLRILALAVSLAVHHQPTAFVDILTEHCRD